VDAKDVALLMSVLIASGAWVYDFPLSKSAIREAYFWEPKDRARAALFVGDYTHAVNELKLGACTSGISLETPFAHVAIHASQAVDYSAQDAVKEFLGKPVVFRMHLEICYLAGAPENAIKVTVIQHKKTERSVKRKSPLLQNP
jgi:hypothetical protein